MKKIWSVLAVGALLVAMPGVSSAVVLGDDCLQDDVMLAEGLVWIGLIGSFYDEPGHMPPTVPEWFAGGGDMESLLSTFLCVDELDCVPEDPEEDADDLVGEIVGPGGEWDGFMVGDGCPDQMQLALLGAVLCEGSSKVDAAGVAADFATNLSEVVALIDNLADLFDPLVDLPSDMGTVGGAMRDAVAPFITALDVSILALETGDSCTRDDDESLVTCDTQEAAYADLLDARYGDLADIDDIGDGLEEIGGAISEYGGLPALLMDLADVMAGLGGMSSEGANTLTITLSDLLAEVVGLDGYMGLFAGGLGAISGNVSDGIAYMEGVLGCDPDLSGEGACADAAVQMQYEILLALDADPTTAAMDALAADIAPLIAGVTDALATLAPPDYLIYGAVAKGVDEPFAGDGDFDGDGISNADEAAAVAAGGGTAADFVAAASGAPGYGLLFPGTAPMPAAGLLGLAILGATVALGGAFVIRKKK